MTMNRNRLLLVLLAGLALQAVPPRSFAQVGGLPGSPLRMGFGARGMAMGNAMTAVDQGEIAGYYNPALLPFTQRRTISASAGFLTLDRSLNFLSFSAPLPPFAGVSAGIINSGVSKIDGRNGDGTPTGMLKTAENAAFLGFALRFPAGFSAGVTIKLLYAHLYTDLTSTTVGVDAGVFVPINRYLRAAATVKDIGSKYKWDTSNLYGQDGKSSVDAFPRLYTAGVEFLVPDSLGIVTAEVEASNKSTLQLRLGAEYPVVPALTLRAGVDRIDLKEKGNGVRPAFGFMVQREMGNWTPALEYTYILEPFTTSGIHMVSVTVLF